MIVYDTLCAIKRIFWPLFRNQRSIDKDWWPSFSCWRRAKSNKLVICIDGPQAYLHVVVENEVKIVRVHRYFFWENEQFLVPPPQELAY